MSINIMCIGDVVARWGVDGDRCTVAAEGAELVV